MLLENRLSSLQDDALRPALLARIETHSQLARQHTSVNTSVDLLRTFQTLQISLLDVSSLLDQGNLQSAVVATKHVGKLLDDTEDWKKQSDTYKLLKVRRQPYRIAQLPLIPDVRNYRGEVTNCKALFKTD